MSFILIVPFAGFIAFGNHFYTLWQPTKSPEEIQLIQIMSVLTCITFLCASQTQSLMMLNTVCNKLRLPVFVNLGIGIASLIIVLIAVNTTDLGVYFIAGTSSILMGLRYLFFNPIYAAHILGRKKTTFYPAIIRGWITFAVMLIVFIIASNIFTVNSWFSFIAVCLPVGIIGYMLSLPLLFRKEELIRLKNKVTKKLRRR